ncbi:MAG: DUF4426 domain-containing protein [Pseudomonadota bacterium]
MKKVKSPLHVVAVLLAILLATSDAMADQFKDIGDAVVHYNAVTTDFFDPHIAKLYGIKRSKNRALLTITVLKKRMGLASQPIKANIQATAVNLSNQITDLKMREIADGGAIYYIAEFPVANKETFDFTVNVKPEVGRENTVKFRKQFFTN